MHRRQRLRACLLVVLSVAVAVVPAAAAAADDTGVYTLVKDGRKHEITTLTRGAQDYLALDELTAISDNKASIYLRIDAV